MRYWNPSYDTTIQETSLHFCKMSYAYCCRSVSLGNRLWDGDLCAGNLIGSALRINSQMKKRKRNYWDDTGLLDADNKDLSWSIGSSETRMAYTIIPGCSLIARYLYTSQHPYWDTDEPEKGISYSTSKSLHQRTVTRGENGVVQLSMVPACRDLCSDSERWRGVVSQYNTTASLIYKQYSFSWIFGIKRSGYNCSLKIRTLWHIQKSWCPDSTKTYNSSK